MPTRHALGVGRRDLPWCVGLRPHRPTADATAAGARPIAIKTMLHARRLAESVPLAVVGVERDAGDIAADLTAAWELLDTKPAGRDAPTPAAVEDAIIILRTYQWSAQSRIIAASWVRNLAEAPPASHRSPRINAGRRDWTRRP